MDAPLDPELLRGVPLEVCLQGIGKHWNNSSIAARESSVTENSYGLSQKTDHIDFFFSHDWKTSRLLKWLSLLVMFNSHAAATAMMLVTSCLVLLALIGGIPMLLWPWLPVCSMLSYAVVFLFWQQLRSFCGKPFLVFLDRLCIAQHDMALKEQGIRGLGSFLEKSQNLTILWSGRYFSRLWCLYEVASYLKDEVRSEHKNIQILPVHLCLLLCIASAQATSWMFAIHVAVGAIGSQGWGMLEHPLLFNLFGRGGAAFIPVALYVGLGCMTRLYQLPRQLQDFRVQDAQCFCCSNDHQHPETGKELPCDRRLVFAVLAKWFGRDGDVEDDWMERFNWMVREKLSSRIAQTIGRGLPPFKYVLSTVCVAPVPYIGFFMVVSLGHYGEVEEEEFEDDYEDSEHHLEKDDIVQDDIVRFLLEELLEFLVPPLYGVFCLLLIMQACRLVFYFFQKWGISTSVLAQPCGRALLALLISPMVWAVLVFGIWVPLIGEFAEGVELPPGVKGIVILLYWALVVAFFFLPTDCSQPGLSTHGTWDPGTIIGSEIPSVSETALKPGLDSALGEDLRREIEEELMSVRF